MRWLAALALLPVWQLAAGTASDVARSLRETGFDPGECYHVRDLTLAKEDIRIYLTEGYLIFSRPVAGRPVAAVFSTEIEAGDGEVMLLPPDRAERKSLSTYIQTPNMDEHFRTVLLLFTGKEYQTLTTQMARNEFIKKMPDIGAVMADRYNDTLHNLAESFQVRLTLDLMGGPRRADLLIALFNNARLGNFDIVYDPDSTEQIVAAQVVTKNGRTFYETWTSFPGQAARSNPQPPQQAMTISSYRIEATVDPDLLLTAVTHVKLKALQDGIVAAPFDITPAMTVDSVKVDGQPAEVLQRESIRASLGRSGNGLFLVIPRSPLRAGQEYDFEFHHSGRVIADAGDRVLFVMARGNWYPVQGQQFADYDLEFRYPKDLDLVTPGDVVSDRTEGDWRITRRKTGSPIRMAGFNLGNYAHSRVQRGGYLVDVCANRALERALVPRPADTTLLVPQPGKPQFRGPAGAPVSPPPPDPLARLQALAGDIASAMEFMASKLGPPALPHLTVSPIPGSFGQGFPGLIYLSTLAYLKDLPAPAGTTSASQEIFFADLLAPHETAHQWWGNRVTAATYRDNWLMEALANYTALLYIEKTKGPRDVDIMLDSYRQQLLRKNESGQTVESAGPIVLGSRLSNSQQPEAWNVITYGKGSWILHMLRRRMGDANFFKMLAAVSQQYDRRDITTEQFRLAAAAFLPKTDDPKLEAFFDQWVYGTGIPTLKLSYSLKGAAPSLRLVGTITQSDADDDVSVSVPVEIQIARGNTQTVWVHTSSDPETFTVPLKAAPLKVTLDPNRSVLRR